MKMEKAVIKVVGEPKLLEGNKSFGYKSISVAAEMNGKTMEITLQETHKGIDIQEWTVVKEDGTKLWQTDFSAFDALGVEVDKTEVIDKCTESLKALREKEEEKRKEEAKIQRGKRYDKEPLIATLMPILKEKGHKVSVNKTREEYIESAISIYLECDEELRIGYNYKGQFEIYDIASHGHNTMVTSRSKKVDKWVEIVESALASEKARKIAVKKEEDNSNIIKNKLEEILGVPVEKKDRSVSTGYGYQRRPSYDTQTYYQPVGSNLEFRKTAIRTEDDKWGVGFQVSGIPTIKDMGKLKELFELFK